MTKNTNSVIDLSSRDKREKQEEIKKIIDLSEILISESQRINLLDENRFKVIRVDATDTDGNCKLRDMVVDRGIPAFQVNEWLDTKNDKINTGKKYANIMCRFLNYLETRNMKYWDVSNNEVEDYIMYRLYGGQENVTLLRSNIKYKTIMDDITVITQFYKWLVIRIKRIKIKFFKKEQYNKCSFLFAEIGVTDYDAIVERRLSSMESSREYIKWYTEEQVDAINSNLNRQRDKAIFLCTVDGGFRIDEAFSIKLEDYDANDRTITPSRTKSKKIRTVKLSERSSNMVDNYIIGERADAEYTSGIHSDCLFININRGRNQGKTVKYSNFLKILKKAAQRAGLPGELIRTHSGRSSKAMEYLKVQARNPELNLTDAQIATNMGWENINSIKPYKDRKNEELGMMAQEKIQAANDAKRKGDNIIDG